MRTDKTLKRNPIAYQICDILADRIFNGEIQGGDRLVESQLQKTFNVSRSPIREALRHLSERRLVTIIPRKGVFVRKVTVKEIQEYIPVRARLEGLAAVLAYPNMNAQTRDNLTELLRNMNASIDNKNMKRFLAHHMRFHDTYINASNNDLLIGLMEDLRLTRSLFQSSYRFSWGDVKKAYNDHKQICKLLCSENTNVQQLEALVRTHIEVVSEKVISYVADSLK